MDNVCNRCLFSIPFTIMIRFSLLPISAHFNFINSSVLISAISKSRRGAVAVAVVRIERSGVESWPTGDIV